MNENTQALVDALRSGNYRQGQGQLRRKLVQADAQFDEYCCLGVACDISGVGSWQPQPESQDYVYEMPDGTGDSIYLPRAVSDWLGWAEDGAIRVNDSIRSPGTLASLNDDGKSFLDIAQAIEDNAEFIERPRVVNPPA